MPELPEVETTRLALCKIFLKEKIKLVRVVNDKLRYTIPESFSSKIGNKTVKRINRKGKFLIFFLSNNTVFVAHLGMTGIFRIEKNYQPQKHDHVIFFLDKLCVIYNDIRKFGFFKLEHYKNINNSQHFKSIGIEPLSEELEATWLSKILRKKSQNIKSFLMNQKYIAGLGNIYCSEALFDAKITPLKICKDLTFTQTQKMIFSIKKVLRKAIKSGGTSLQNFEDPYGNIGYFSNHLKVYNRFQEVCYRCQKDIKIIKVIIQGRSTFYCRRCQK
tara:strand:- start:384 stop:1205 length:822 start_codon:yes stop_codon:yes gene_type:complete